MRTRVLWLGAVVLGATLLVSGSCGGGGGSGGGVTVADLAGGWFGPTGTTTPDAQPVGAGTGGMLADDRGNAAEQLNGADTGETIVFSLYDPSQRLFTFTTTDGRQGIARLSGDRNHLLYVDDALRIGAWQRNEVALAQPYMIEDIRDSRWGGLLIDVAPDFRPEELLSADATISVSDRFQVANAATNVVPLVVVEALNGQYRGDFITTEMPATHGDVLLLITPDRLFLAVMASGGPSFPEDATFGAWQRR